MKIYLIFRLDVHDSGCWWLPKDRCQIVVMQKKGRRNFGSCDWGCRALTWCARLIANADGVAAVA
jgi:hypothetical protein